VEEERKSIDRLSKYFSDEADGDDDAQGLYCQDCYSESIDGWDVCCRCHNWASTSCAGVDSDGDETVHVGCQCMSLRF